MANFEFQAIGSEKPKKTDIHHVDKFPAPASDEEKLTDEQKEKIENSLVDLFVESRGGPAFQNRLASILLKQDIPFDENDPYYIKMTRMLSDDRRTDNKEISEVMRAVSSLVFFLRKGIEAPDDPEKERLVGFNNALDAQYSVDVIDIEYEIIDGQVVVSKLHLIDVKSFEGMAVDSAGKARRDHSELAQKFEMMAKWQDTPEVDLSAKEELQQELLADFIEAEAEELALLEACGEIESGVFDAPTLKEKISSNLHQDASLEVLEVLEEALSEKRQETADPDLEKAIDEIIEVIKQSEAEVKTRKIKKRSPVVFAPDVEVKSILAAKKLSSGAQGGILHSLTRDMSPPGRVLEAA
ncbi:hypothetical protein C0580_02735 [Candidatus Parcubacteria bacterium]|nr:MAG: hypothetical protein C0580_02735 [Candidatus Parcubacteria bacterium]